MLGRSVSMIAAGVITAGMLAPAAHAGTRDYLVYDQRRPGLPATDDPARTISDAGGVITDQRTAWVSVTLGARPDEASAAELDVVFGTLDPAGVCVGPNDAGTQTTGSQSYEFAVKLDPLWESDTGCTYVELVDPATGELLDRLDGRVTGTVIVDPAAPLRIGGVRHRILPEDRWSWIRVPVRLSRPADLVRVDTDAARVEGVQARVVRLRDVPSGLTSVRVPVRLGVPHVRRMLVRVRASGDFRSALAVTRTTLRPKR